MRLLRWIALAALAAPLPAAWAQAPARPSAPGAPAKPRSKRLNMEPIDFTPRAGELRFDGVPTRVTIFNRGEDRIAVLTRAPWTASGSSNEFVLTATEFPQARITLRRSALPRPSALDEPWAAETSNLILRSLPQDSNRSLRERKASPLVINDWKSFEISVAFDQFGGRFVRGYLFVLTPRGELLELVTGAREQDYNAVRSAAVSILASWQEMTAQQFVVYQTGREAPVPTPAPAPATAKPSPSR